MKQTLTKLYNMPEYTIYAGSYEGTPIYRTLPEEEANEMLKAGFTWSEIESFYKMTDWQQDC